MSNLASPNGLGRRLLVWFGFGDEASHLGHSHDGHDHGPGGHGHTHGVIDPSIATTDAWHLGDQMVVRHPRDHRGAAVGGRLAISGSVALLADTIHNIGDATTAIPLWIAFVLVRRPADATLHLRAWPGRGSRRHRSSC